MRDLFAEVKTDLEPLAARMRPVSLDEVMGQEHLLGEGKSLRAALDRGVLHSMVFWGPPGVGKTTLARLMANQAGARFTELSAVLAGVKDLREAVSQARELQRLEQRDTILFIDEIHRFSKSQQDSLLAPVEDGSVILVGATTENPSFELNNALLSRLRVYVLRALDEDALMDLMKRALSDTSRGLGEQAIVMNDAILHALAKAADGDARRCLNLVQIAADLAVEQEGRLCIDEAVLDEVLQGHLRRFDKQGDIFYDQISALHKSVRGSHPDAALYWLCRMLDGGCDPIYIARRVVRMAAEDIGNADPRGLTLALSAWESYERLGSPEGELAIAQAVVYLAVAAKSNAVYSAYKAAMADAKASGSQEVPMHLRNAPTRLMKALGYGDGYRYAHDEVGGYAAGERYFPEGMGERCYYEPVERGMELKIKEKLDRLRQSDREYRGKKSR